MNPVWCYSRKIYKITLFLGSPFTLKLVPISNIDIHPKNKKIKIKIY